MNLKKSPKSLFFLISSIFLAFIISLYIFALLDIRGFFDYIGHPVRTIQFYIISPFAVLALAVITYKVISKFITSKNRALLGCVLLMALFLIIKISVVNNQICWGNTGFLFRDIMEKISKIIFSIDCYQWRGL